MNLLDMYAYYLQIQPWQCRATHEEDSEWDKHGLSEHDSHLKFEKDEK